MDSVNKLALTLLGVSYLLGDAAIALDNLRQASFYSQRFGREEFRRRTREMPAIGIISYTTGRVISAMPNLFTRRYATSP
ncbi:MAG: hypothetical protein HYW25_05160 [Candidatus Aenigmarchaeota archaeon]|nr:hypothetical protein [Candidatus Aenigmarchaeota archaeon]